MVAARYRNPASVSPFRRQLYRSANCGAFLFAGLKAKDFPTCSVIEAKPIDKVKCMYFQQQFRMGSCQVFAPVQGLTECLHV